MHGFAGDSGSGLPKAAPLAHREDFTLGNATIRPSLRTLIGPGRAVTLEPRVMEVLLAFVESNGTVVAREDLIRSCWDGRIVGEDAVNRVIAALRKAFRQSGTNLAIETIPRIGYRFEMPDADPAIADASGRSVPQPDRRRAVTTLLGGGAALAAGVAGFTILRRRSSEATNLSRMSEARRALHDNYPDSGARAAALLKAVVQEEPRNAKAWGLLAFAHRDIAEGAPPVAVSTAIRSSEEAARRALALDPDEGNALAARAALRPHFGEYAAGEDRLRAVLARHPSNFLATLHLVPLYQGVGRVRLSATFNERTGAIDPQSPVPHYRRGLKLWGLGQIDTAEQAIERAMQLWPRHPGVWNARMMMFAYSGRPDAALALLDQRDSHPTTLKPPHVDLWRISLQALRSRTPAAIATAREANVAAAARGPGFANSALLTLAALGELDAAFAVAFGYFLKRGPLITTIWESEGELPVSALRWRRSMALFVPPTAPMRGDPRFGTLMEGMGIARYWRDRGVRPDAQLGLDWMT